LRVQLGNLSAENQQLCEDNEELQEENEELHEMIGYLQYQLSQFTAAVTAASGTAFHLGLTTGQTLTAEQVTQVTQLTQLTEEPVTQLTVETVTA
jgi:cell division septum initiation protein DivIVA